MAYQPKSYKKFVATAATATLVATAVVPAAFADDVTTAAFTDVAPQYQAAVDFVVEQAIAKGISETQFGISKEIIRGDAAIMIANAAGLNNPDAPASGFTDVPTRGALAINSLKAAGVTNGVSATSFDFSGDITRGEAAIFLANAFDLEGDVSNVKFTDVNSRYMAAVAALVDNNVTNGKSATQFGTDDNITRGDFARWLLALEDLIVDPTPTTPGVATVTAVNAKQVVVTFNTPVDEDTLVATDGTLVDGAISISALSGSPAVNANTAKAELSEDGKTLVLSASGTEVFDGSYTLTVTDAVETVDGDALPAYSTTFEFEDEVTPSVLSTSYDVATGLITVTFTEPLKTAPTTVRLNGQPVSPVNFTVGSNKITFENTASAGTTAQVYVAGATDYNNNQLAPSTSSVYIQQPSTEALTVTSAAQVDSNVARIVFDKKVAGATPAAAAASVEAALTVIQDGAALSNSTDVTVTPVAADTTGRSFDVTISVKGATGPSYGLYDSSATTEAVTFLLAEGEVEDVFGNENGVYNNTLTFTQDLTGPSAISATGDADDETLRVTFNEDLANTVDSSEINVRLDGVNQTFTASVDSEDSNVLVLDLAGTTLEEGSYTIRLGAGAVTDEHTNENVLQTLTANIDLDETATPLEVDDISNVTGEANQFTVAFSEEVTNSALNLANYTLDGAALPAGTDIYFTDSFRDAVVIVLPADSVNIGEVGTGTNALLGVKNVVDTDGDVVQTTYDTVSIEDNTSADLLSAQLVGNSTMVFTFNEAIDESSAPTTFGQLIEDFDIIGGSTTLTADDIALADTTALETAVSGNQIVVTVIDDEGTNFETVAASRTITVETAENVAIEDINGVVVEEGVKVTVAK